MSALTAKQKQILQQVERDEEFNNYITQCLKGGRCPMCGARLRGEWDGYGMENICDPCHFTSHNRGSQGWNTPWTLREQFRSALPLA